MFFTHKRKNKTNTNLYGFIRTIRPETPLYNMILEELNNMEAITQENKNIINNSEPLYININLRVMKKGE